MKAWLGSWANPVTDALLVCATALPTTKRHTTTAVTTRRFLIFPPRRRRNSPALLFVTSTNFPIRWGHYRSARFSSSREHVTNPNPSIAPDEWMVRAVTGARSEGPGVV